MIFFIIFRKNWSCDEDIQLLKEFQKTPKKWAKISRKLVKRNEHQIKNRFICLMAKEICCKNEEIRGFLRHNCISGWVSMVLNTLEQKKINEEELTEKNQNFSQINENIEQFLNF